MNDWNIKHMLRNKGNMRRGKFHDCSGGPFLRRAMWGGGGEVVGGWDEGLFDFEKNVYSVYPGSAYRYEKNPAYLVHSPKKFTNVQWAKKKG